MRVLRSLISCRVVAWNRLAGIYWRSSREEMGKGGGRPRGVVMGAQVGGAGVIINLGLLVIEE